MTDMLTGINLRYRAEDAVWAEWIEEVLGSVGVAVSRAGEGRAGRRTVLIVSSPDALALPDLDPLDAQLLAVYVTDMPPPARFVPLRSAGLAGLDRLDAVEALLRLVGRPRPARLPETDGRFPGEPASIFEGVPPRNVRFTGRDDTLRHLRAQFRSPGTDVVAPVVLVGDGGVGKRQVALEYAYRHANAYDVVWWVKAEPPQFVDSSFSDLAVRLGLATGGKASDHSRLAVQALSRGEPTDRWLLILDSAEDVAHIAGLLPSGRGHILITSRNRGWDGQARAVVLDVFTRDESIAHVLTRVPTATGEEADRVAQALGDLPIAVSVFSALVGRTDMPIEAPLRQIEGAGDNGAAVSAVWDLAVDWLTRHSPSTYRLLQLCSTMAPDIAQDLLDSDQIAAALAGTEPGPSRGSGSAALVDLVSLALVKEDRAGHTVHVPRLLQEAVRERMSPDELADVRHQVHLALVSARPQGEVDDPSIWPGFRVLWPHLLMSDADICDDENVRQLLIDRLRYLWLRGDLDQAEQFGSRVSADWTAVLQRDGWQDRHLHRQLMHLRFNLANIVRSRGRFQEAREIDESVLAAQRASLGEDHPHTLMTAGSLAADLRGLGLYREALVMAEVTFAAWSASAGADSPRALSAANNLATSHRLMGDFRAARDVDEQVLRRRQLILGPAHPYTLHSASCLGRDYRELGEYARSVDLLWQVYRDIVAARGSENAEAHIARANLAASLRAVGRPDEAMELLEEAFGYLRASFGGDSPDTQACRLSLATNLLTVGDYESAEREMRSVMQAYAHNLGDTHPHTLICLSNLSAIRRSREDLAQAREYAERAARELMATLGAAHSSTVAARMNLAACLADSREFAPAAEETAAAAINLARILGPSHPDTLRCRMNLALIRAAQGDPDPEADAVLAELVALVGEDHPSVRTLRAGALVHRVIDPHPF